MKAISSPLLLRLFPFLRWFPLPPGALRADLVAGVTVSLVLVPQSMAYAQLAGLPPYYGLYAAFLPVLVGALWGSSNQLATGPVAMVSILTGSTLVQFAAPGAEHYIALAVALSFMVGVMQFALGALRLGAIVSFLSHPVIVGFTNAAAIIIGLSQLNKLLGVSVGRSDSFLADIWGVLQQAGDIHAPTLAMGLGAFALMYTLRRRWPKLPGVLIAVALATLLSWATGFERNIEATIADIADADARALATEYASTARSIATLEKRIDAQATEIKTAAAVAKPDALHRLTLDYQLQTLRLEKRALESENRLRSRALRRFHFVQAGEPARLHSAQSPQPGTGADAVRWRIQRISGERLLLAGGGEVVGRVPEGLPEVRLPPITIETMSLLLSSALVITLVAFMEAISIAKAMATRTRQRIDPNQELIGQGLANVVGSMTQCYPASGSFSRSAVNLSAGAVTGMSSVFTVLVVLITLLFLTPLLYHLPQSVLAAVIMLAVVGLIDFGAIRHAWQAHRHDGIAAVVTFVATLLAAPHLDVGILIGGALALVLYLYRTMAPRVAILGRHADGTLRDAALHGLPASEHVVIIRFDGQLYFANVPYFEDAVLEAAAKHPRAKFVLVVGDGINEIDASGEEVVRHLQRRLAESGITMVFSGLKKQVLDVMRATGLFDAIGERHLFRTEDMALAAIRDRLAADDLPLEAFLLPGRRER
jgi:SulP family sulfate permease